MKSFTTNERFIYEVRTLTEGWVRVSTYRIACLMSQRITEVARKDSNLRGMNYGGIREKLV